MAKITDKPVVAQPTDVEAGAAKILRILTRAHIQNKSMLKEIRSVVQKNTRSAIVAELGATLASDVLAVYAALKNVAELTELGGESIDDIPA